MPTSQPLASQQTTPAAADVPRKRRWPDLSAYGIHFGVTTMPNGESRLVMVDEDAAWPQLARQLGFVQSRWLGVYSKPSPRLDFKGMSSMFPKARVVELTDDEIRARIKPLLLAHRDKRLSQLASHQKRLSWHPAKTVVADAAAIASAPAAEQQAPINPEAALHQTIFLGLNFQGQSVYESGDGVRFIKAGDAVLASETHAPGESPTFLRAKTDSDLVQVASGMVREIVDGKNLKSDDFIRYVDAAFGVDSSNDKSLVSRFHLALDQAMRAHITAQGGVGRDAFDVALRLHEGRPSFWRADGEMPTPMPIALVMQAVASSKMSSIAAEKPETEAQFNVIEISAHAGSNTWAMDAKAVSPAEITEHDVALAGVFSAPINEESVGGVRVTRTESKLMLQALDKRADKGVSTFVMSTDKAGRLDTEFKRILSSLGQTHEILGLVDLDAGLFGAGNTIGSRLLVVGDKRKQPDFTFSVPGGVPVIFDYERLWTWCESVKSLDSSEVITFGDDGREENRWQAPYIPKSQISEPTAMCPRNLLGPLRKALARVVESTGMDIDAFVCHKMGWTIEQLAERLDAEQVDALALAITALDEGAGFTTADMTGLGKGRVVASLCAYARQQGKKVIFMTEKADLFTDFYRDVIDTGGMEVLGNPFVVNNDLVVRNPYTRKVMFRSPDRDQASAIFACGEFPTDSDVVLATYSQFNREHDAADSTFRVRAARDIRALLAGKKSVFEAMIDNAFVLGLPNYAEVAAAAGSTLDAAFVKTYEENLARAARTGNNEAQAKIHDLHASYVQMDAAKFVEVLRPLIGTNFTTLKHRWLHSEATTGALLIMDEAHVAAGDASKTGVNMQSVVDRAAGVVYSSATYAKDVKNFRLYGRMFPNTLRVATIAETLSRGGEPMQEIVSAMLAEDGRLIRREHDLSSIEFQVIAETTRRDRNVEWADSFAAILAAMSELSGELGSIAGGLDSVYKKKAEAEQSAQHKILLQAAKAKAAAAGKSVGSPGFKTPKAPKLKLEGGVGYTSFASKLYNISRAFSMALTADLAADRAIDALQAGRKPVITVENTMETTLKELVEGVQIDDVLEEGASDASAADPLAGVEDGNDSSQKGGRAKIADIPLGKRVSFKDILGAYIDAMFGAWEYTYSPEGKIKTKKRVDLATPELRAVAQEIRKQIEDMAEIPLSPIDLVRQRIKDAGFTVDEISGRQYTLVEGSDGYHVVSRMGKRNKQVLKDGFNSAEIDALILSKSGSTGISLHASRTFIDQSQRVLVELQPAADIAQRLQFWGRVNRKGQVCSPIVQMLSSGLPAENRLIAMQNNKLRRMSANTNGSSDNSAINEDAPDIINKIGNEVCLRWMENNAKLASIIGFEIPEDSESAHLANTKFVDMLTSRMMMFPVAKQEAIYKDIVTEFKAVMEQHEMEGRNPLKAAEYDLKAKVKEERVIQVATGVASAFDQAVIAQELVYEIKLPALDRDFILAEAEMGRIALENDHGKTWYDTLGKEYANLTAAVLPSLLSRKYATIEAAMASEESNAVRRAMARASWFEHSLAHFCPGSIVWFGDDKTQSPDDRDDSLDRIFITEIKVPEDGRLSLSKWKVAGYSTLKRKRVEVSLSSITTRSIYSRYPIEGRKDRESKYYERDVDSFFKRAEVPFEGVASRVVLGGNLYKAAEVAESLNSGQTITYSDAKGVWHHAVLMPANMSIRSVCNLPVIVTDVDMAIEAAAHIKATRISDKNEKGSANFNFYEDYAMITDSFKTSLNSHGQKANSYTIRVEEDVAEMSVTLTKSIAKALMNNKELTPLLAAPWDVRSREYAVACSAPGMLKPFLEQVFKILEDSGTKILLSGNMRAWYNERISKITGLVNTAALSIEMAAKDEADELDALLEEPSAAPAP